MPKEDYAEALIINVSTGESYTQKLTPEEVLRRDADALETETSNAVAAVLKNEIITLAQTAEGILVSDLSNTQVRALLLILLRKEGAIDSDLTIKPLNEWVN
jgi:hypothetical protein